LDVYIDVTVDDNTKRLIIYGSPSEAELEEAKLKLVSDFSELSGGGEAKAFNYTISQYYLKRSVIIGFELSIRLILAGRFEAAVDYLNKNGVKCSVPKDEAEFNDLIDLVHKKYKNKIANAKYLELTNRYRELSLKKEEKPTRRYYTRLLVMLSSCEAIRIQLNPKKMTVAEFAEYINLFNEYQNILKNIKNGRGRKH
jgi:hypothetical protein